MKKPDVTTATKSAVGMIVLALGGTGGTMGYHAIVAAADRHIDDRVDQGIQEYHVQQIEGRVEFYDMKKDMAPERFSQDDQTNLNILNKQLEKARDETGDAQ